MINEQVRDREVRVISSNGEQLGIMSSKEAMKLARGAELDLVKIAPNAKPPVCKIIDYGKYRYELARKEKEAKKKKIRSSEHGWGMKILEDIAQQYNGRLEYGFKDGIYSTMVSLVYTNNQEESI